MSIYQKETYSSKCAMKKAMKKGGIKNVGKRKTIASTTTLSPKSVKKGDRNHTKMTHPSGSESERRNPLREVCTYLDYEKTVGRLKPLPFDNRTYYLGNM